MSARSPVPIASRTIASSGAPCRHREKIRPGCSVSRLAMQIVPAGCVTRAAAATPRIRLMHPACGCASEQIASIAGPEIFGLHAAACARACRAATSGNPNVAAASEFPRPATSRRLVATPSCHAISCMLARHAASARRPRLARQRRRSCRLACRENVGHSSPSSDRPPRAAL